MTATLRRTLIVIACLGLAGCALWPAAALNLAAQGATGVVALALVPMANAHERSGMDRCAAAAARGISVTESLEPALARFGEDVVTFEPAYWRPQFAREGYPKVEVARTAVEGALSVGERAVLFVPAPGAVSVSIPYELVEGVALSSSPAARTPDSIVVRSCQGRFDIVTIGSARAGRANPEAAATAVTRLNERVAAFQSAADD
jgi:hypothetical protein